MRKIIVEIKNSTLNFSLNKNFSNQIVKIYNANEYIFDFSYQTKDDKAIDNAIAEMRKYYNIDNINTISIENNSIAPYVLEFILPKLPNINNILFLEDTPIYYDICERLINTNIKYISCYKIAHNLQKILNKNGIQVNDRLELLFITDFMKKNKLSCYLDVYYKERINLDLPLNDARKQDFITFLNFNRHLNAIYLDTCTKEDATTIMTIIQNAELKDIRIYIKEDVQDADLFKYLKKLNNRYKKSGNQFTIDYTEEYIEQNIGAQLKISAMKLCGTMTLVILCTILLSSYFQDLNSYQEIKNIQNEVNSVIQNRVEDNQQTSEDATNKVTRTKDLSDLLELNSDTVGWLQVNNTNIDYPVVQSSNNDYYLTRNYKKNKDTSGWLFMDYRNDEESKHTIIYGHSNSSTNVMFGTLNKVLQSSWHTNKNNQIIEYSSLNQTMKWQIFSIYTIPETSDYLRTDFLSDNDYLQFVKMLKNRSIYNFNVEITATDRIISLSTCPEDNEHHLVVHAVLID